VVLEFEGQQRRYTSEKSAQQLLAIADYLRARSGFVSDRGLAEVLEVPVTKLAAWKHGLDVPESIVGQLLSHLAVVVQELSVFLDPDVIPDWLLTEQHTLGGRSPVEALRSGQLAEVLQAANATEHGAFV
jgi:hypothetical protein